MLVKDATKAQVIARKSSLSLAPSEINSLDDVSTKHSALGSSQLEGDAEEKSSQLSINQVAQESQNRKNAEELALTNEGSLINESKKSGLNLLAKYSKQPLGSHINSLNIPRWSKAFLSLNAHLTPLVLTTLALDKIKIPKQLKSSLGLTAMYLGVWGNQKLNDLPKLIGITSASSLLADAGHLPGFLRRSLLGFTVTSAQHLADHGKTSVKSSGGASLSRFFKDYGLKLLQTELKINTALPIMKHLSAKIPNKFLSSIIKVFGISALITIIGETLRAVGISSSTSSAANDVLSLSEGCPICGGAHAECISSDLAPAASSVDDLHKHGAAGLI
jgi:hypothetical protein